MFNRLKHTLPPPPPVVEVKHNAQVLDYAIFVFKTMVERTAQPEVNLVISSNQATMEWISKLVQQTETFPEAAKRMMRLFIVRHGWLHAELWTSNKQRSNNKNSNIKVNNANGAVLGNRTTNSSSMVAFCDASNNHTNHYSVCAAADNIKNNQNNYRAVVLSFCDAVVNENYQSAVQRALEAQFSHESEVFRFRANEGV